MERISLIIGALGFVYGFYHVYIAIAGSLKKYTPIAYAQPSKRIAAVIPARNEEKVVGLLVDSLKKQRYPSELLDIYVVANNCTDDTAGSAKNAGANVLTCDPAVQSKGDVLRCAFNQLLNGDVSYDAFVVLDADNLVNGGFMQAVNNALCAGYQVGQAYRDSKNPDDGWVAGCTSMFFWYMNGLFNRTRATLGMSASLNGTGIMIGEKFLRRYGYHVQTLTEDLELTAQCALDGERIAWLEDAVTYDEQPITFRDSLSQRRRWAAGTRQCVRLYLVKLYKNAVKSQACRDVALHFSGVFPQCLGVIPAIYTIYRLVLNIIKDPAKGSVQALYALGAVALFFFLGGIASSLLVCLLEKKLTKKRVADSMMMGVYLVTWIFTNLIGYLWIAPKWVEIPHVSNVNIDHCEQSPDA